MDKNAELKEFFRLYCWTHYRRYMARGWLKQAVTWLALIDEKEILPEEAGK